MPGGEDERHGRRAGVVHAPLIRRQRHSQRSGREIQPNSARAQEHPGRVGGDEGQIAVPRQSLDAEVVATIPARGGQQEPGCRVAVGIDHTDERLERPWNDAERSGIGRCRKCDRGPKTRSGYCTNTKLPRTTGDVQRREVPDCRRVFKKGDGLIGTTVQKLGVVREREGSEAVQVQVAAVAAVHDEHGIALRAGVDARAERMLEDVDRQREPFLEPLRCSDRHVQSTVCRWPAAAAAYGGLRASAEEGGEPAGEAMSAHGGIHR